MPAGVAKRILTTYGTIRQDMGEGCPEWIDLDFLKWICNFSKDKRRKNYCHLNEAEKKKTIVLNNRRAVRKFLAQL